MCVILKEDFKIFPGNIHRAFKSLRQGESELKAFLHVETLHYYICFEKSKILPQLEKHYFYALPKGDSIKCQVFVSFQKLKVFVIYYKV